MAWCMAQHQAEEKESSSVYVHVLYSVQVSQSGRKLKGRGFMVSVRPFLHFICNVLRIMGV